MQTNDDLLRDLALQVDGLLEICVLGTAFEDWCKVMAFVRGSGNIVSETVAGVPETIDLSQAWSADGEDLSRRLEIAVGGQRWTTNFYSVDMIDFQGEPTEITSEDTLDSLCRFMRDLHRVTGKPVILIPESVRPTEVKPYVEFR